jgi:starch synthase
MRPLNVLSVASEIFPIIKTGGLADVTGALPGALANESVRMMTLIPGYPAAMRSVEGAEVVRHYDDLYGGTARLLAANARDLELFILDAPHLYDRPGSPYVTPEGWDWPDNAQRFAALSQVAAMIGRGGLPGFQPDVVHAHDWQAGLVPAYLHYAGGRRPGTVVTVHNIAFQGGFPAYLLSDLNLPHDSFRVDGVEYYGQIGFLKAGLHFADRITTVSPTYAVEIQTPDGGMGLDGLLRTRSDIVSGILNGIDEAVWDPATDPHLVARFDSAGLEARAANKKALQERLGLRPDPKALLFGVVSRLSEQKGLDLLLGGLADLIADGAQLALLGAGDRGLEAAFQASMAAHPGQIGCFFGYDEVLAHQIQGGSDALLVPSRFEPCGLTQLCAMRYGTIPIVARVGGLADTIIDANEMAVAAGAATGIQFSPVTPAAFGGAISRAKALWRDRTNWERLQRNGMALDVGWTQPAKRYAELYRACAGPVSSGTS